MLRRVLIHPLTMGVALAAVLIWIGLWFLSPLSAAGTQLRRASYDAYYSWFDLARVPPTNCPVIIIYLDLQSFLASHNDPAQPWPRNLHARLLELLTKAGARAAAFDIVFDTPGPKPEADAELAAAIRANGRVILASELGVASAQHSPDLPWGRGTQEALPLKLFLESAAGVGFGDVAVDEDFVARRHHSGNISHGRLSLSYAVANFLGQHSNISQGSGRWMRYYGKPFALPHVSYAAALDLNALPDYLFRDKVVFVGARPITGLFRERHDEFRSPFRGWREPDLYMPGVEVHATEALNLIQRDWLVRPPAPLERWMVVSVGALLAAVFVRARPARATMFAGGVCLVVLVAALLKFEHGSLWFPWLIVCAVQVPLGWSVSVAYKSIEWYRTRRRLEAERRVAETRIREQAALISNAHDAILVQDLAGRITYANPAAEGLYGWSVSELGDPKITAELFSPALERAAEAVAGATAHGEWNGELSQRTKTGTTIDVLSRWTLIRDEAGAPKAFLVINSDITDKKQLEAQFLRAQRMETIGALAGGMAHDLNNALAPILIGAQLLRRKSADGEANRLRGLI